MRQCLSSSSSSSSSSLSSTQMMMITMTMMRAKLTFGARLQNIFNMFSLSSLSLSLCHSSDALPSPPPQHASRLSWKFWLDYFVRFIFRYRIKVSLFFVNNVCQTLLMLLLLLLSISAPWCKILIDLRYNSQMGKTCFKCPAFLFAKGSIFGKFLSVRFYLTLV